VLAPPRRPSNTPKKKAAYVSHEQRKFARIVDRAAFRGLAGNQVAGIIVFTILEA
jgi:hypothetical protein